jgi:hypothetical protein
LLTIGHAMPSAFSRESVQQAGEGQTRCHIDQLRQSCRLLRRLHAAASAAGVALDQHSQRLARRKISGKPIDRDAAVGHNLEIADALVKRRQSRELFEADNVEGDQDVLEAGGGKHLRLGDLLAIDALGAGGNLLRCERRNLVGLDMRPKFSPCASM